MSPTIAEETERVDPLLMPIEHVADPFCVDVPEADLVVHSLSVASYWPLPL